MRTSTVQLLQGVCSHGTQPLLSITTPSPGHIFQRLCSIVAGARIEALDMCVFAPRIDKLQSGRSMRKLPQRCACRHCKQSAKFNRTEQPAEACLYIVYIYIQMRCWQPTIAREFLTSNSPTLAPWNLKKIRAFVDGQPHLYPAGKLPGKRKVLFLVIKCWHYSYRKSLIKTSNVNPGLISLGWQIRGCPPPN